MDPASTVRTAEDRVEAARRHSKILGRLRAMPSREAGILQVAYEPSGWPVRLVDELGVLTGIVVRLMCAETGLPEDREALKGMEQSVARRLAQDQDGGGGRQSLERLRVEAQRLLVEAHHAYTEVRNKEKSAMGTAKKTVGPVENVEALPVRGFYKLSELARAGGMSRYLMGRVLESVGIATVGPIPLLELETKGKRVLDSIRCVERLRQEARDEAASIRDLAGQRTLRTGAS